jgi:glucokinase
VSEPHAILAAEIGGTKLQAALCDPDGALLHSLRSCADPARGAEGVLAWFERTGPAMRESAERLGRRIAAAGVGFGGPVDVNKGTALLSHQVPGWEDYPLRAWFEAAYDVPALVHNDSNAAGWGEYRLGAGRGTRFFCYMNIGSGIGGAFILGGELYNGRGLGGGDIGHTLAPDWDEPGRPRKLEDLCSGWSLETYMRERMRPAPGGALHAACGGDPATLTCPMLGQAAEAGDPQALALIDRAAASVGTALANVVTLVHPERIAVGGGVGLLGETLLRPVRAYCGPRVFTPYRGTFDIVSCELGEGVVLAGAALLARQAFLD